ALGVVGGDQRAGIGAVEHERGYPVWVAGGELDGDRPRPRPAQQRRPPDSGGGEHALEVPHLAVEGEALGSRDRVGMASTALVVAGQGASLREPLVKARISGVPASRTRWLTQPGVTASAGPVPVSW